MQDLGKIVIPQDSAVTSEEKKFLESSLSPIKPQNINVVENTGEELPFVRRSSLNSSVTSCQTPVTPNTPMTTGGTPRTAFEFINFGGKSPFEIAAQPIKKPYSPDDTLAAYGYTREKKIADTLQGMVYFGLNSQKQKVVIKMTEIELHKRGITIQKGKKIKVKENVIQEKNLMHVLQSYNPPPGFVCMVDYFKDSKYFYVVQDFGGSDFFAYISDSHEMIKNNIMPIREWKKHIQHLFAQMLVFVSWLHLHGVAHLDISLENILIKDVNFSKEKKKFLNHGQLYFIDFGLAESFNKSLKGCQKYVGKTPYKAPRVYAKKSFHAGLADVWSMGVCLFMMTVGCPPYQRPTLKDPYFENLWNGFTKEVLTEWGLANRMPKVVLALLDQIFTTEDERISIGQIIEHPYCKEAVHKVKKRYGLNNTNFPISPTEPKLSVYNQLAQINRFDPDMNDRGKRSQSTFVQAKKHINSYQKLNLNANLSSNSNTSNSSKSISPINNVNKLLNSNKQNISNLTISTTASSVVLSPQTDHKFQNSFLQHRTSLPSTPISAYQNNPNSIIDKKYFSPSPHQIQQAQQQAIQANNQNNTKPKRKSKFKNLFK